MTEQNRQDITKIIVSSNPLKQEIVAIEELSELIKEVTKMTRGNGSLIHLTEEIADCLIVIEELKILFGIDEDIIANFIEAKIKRTKNTLGINEEVVKE